MANKITYGLRNVYYALRLADDSQGEPAWDTPVAIQGAVSFKPTPEGDEFKMYADDTVYFSNIINNGYSAELTMANVSDEVLADMLNWEVDANGALVENADALSAPFALMFEVQGDDKNRRSVFYECRASRPSREETTKEATIAPGQDVLSLTISPIIIEGQNLVRSVLQLSGTNESVYTGFYTAVYVPESSS